MAETIEAVLARIRSIAEEALRQTGAPPAITEALKQIASLARPSRDDTLEASDPPSTENQTL